MGRKLRDYIVIWNAGVGFIYLLIGTIAILYGIDSLHLVGDFGANVEILKTRFTTLKVEEIVMIVVFGVIWLAGVNNFFYVRRALLEYKTRSFVSFMAPFMLTLANALAVTVTFFDIQLQGNHFGLQFRGEFINSLNWVGWSAVGLVCLSALFSVVGIVAMLKAAVKPVAIAENEFERKERIAKEKEKARLKKEHEKERKKNKSMAVRPKASREKVSDEEMMFKSGDVSLEDEALAAQIAEKRKNPFLKDDAEGEKAAADAPKNSDLNPNGVPLAAVKDNPVLSTFHPVLEPATVSPNISPNIASEADSAAPAPATPAEGAPMGGGAVDPSAMGLDDGPEAPKTPDAPEAPAAPAGPIISG